MKRRFVVLAGSIDEMRQFSPLLARCVSATLMISHGLRANTDLLLYSLSESFAVHFVSESLKGVRPDEASLLGILTKAFRALHAAGNRPRSVYSGVLICKRGLNAYLAQFPSKLFCDTQGLDLKYVAIDCQQDVLFAVPLRPGLRVEGMERLKCPLDVLWPDQVISLLNLYLDRRCGK